MGSEGTPQEMTMEQFGFDPSNPRDVKIWADTDPSTNTTSGPYAYDEEIDLPPVNR